MSDSAEDIDAALSELLGEPPPPPAPEFAPTRVRLAALLANMVPKRQRFVIRYLEHGEGKRAAIEAGFAESSAAVMAHRLLHDAPEVRDAIALARREMAETNAYDVEGMTARYEAAAVAASNDKQHNAVVKALDSISRLHGLFIDKKEIEINARVSIRDALAAAQGRLERFERARGQCIEAEFRTVQD